LLQAEVMRNKTPKQKSGNFQGDALDVVRRDPNGTPSATSPRHSRSQLVQSHSSKLNPLGVTPSVSHMVSSTSPSKTESHGQSTTDGVQHIGNSLKDAGTLPGNIPSTGSLGPSQLTPKVSWLSTPVLSGSALQPDKVSSSQERAPISRMTSEAAPRDMSGLQAQSSSSQQSPSKSTTPFAVSTHVSRSPETMKQTRTMPADAQGGSGQLPPGGNVRMGQYTPVCMSMSPQLVGSNLYNKPAMGMIPGRTTAPSGQYVPLSR